MTGHGFYAEFETPSDVPLAVPASFAGGNAEIVLEGTAAGAGCVLFIRDGRLATLEGYTFGDEGWAENAASDAAPTANGVILPPSHTRP